MISVNFNALYLDNLKQINPLEYFLNSKGHFKFSEGQIAQKKTLLAYFAIHWLCP